MHKYNSASPIPEMDIVSSGIYSNTYINLLEYLKQNQNSTKLTFNYSDEKIPDFMKNYEYPISPTPVIISQEDIEQHNQFIKKIVPLIYKALEVFFMQDENMFAEYMNESPFLLPFIQETPYEPANYYIRYDGIFSEKNFKVLEINIGTTVGGWQHDWLSPVIIDSLNSNTNIDCSTISHKNVTNAMFSSLYRTITKNSTKKKANVLFFAPENHKYQKHYKHQIDSFKNGYRKVWNEVKQDTDGELYFFDCFESLTFTERGELFYNSIRIDALLLALPEQVTVPNDIMMKLLTCSTLGNLVLPDNPAITVVGNKSALALLHEPKFLQSLDQEDISYIQKHIPWTAKFKDTQIIWQGESYSLLSFLHSHKEQLVIKKAHSQQGKDVYIGCYCDTEKWSEAIAKASQSNDWIVQQFCLSDEFVCMDPEGNLVTTNPVWGIFDVDNTYSGAFLRAQLAAKRGGVINSSNGAVEFMVLQENPIKKRSFVI